MAVVRSYFDSSGKATENFLTLAAFVGDDEIWEEFEIEWNKILTTHNPPAKYIHMRELVHQNAGFDRKLGWNDTNTGELVLKCLMFMQHLDKKRFRMFYCAIDLGARRELVKQTFQIPDPVSMCNEFCSKNVLGWIIQKYPGIFDFESTKAHFFFDKDEPFHAAFERRWKDQIRITELKGARSLWSVLKLVSSVEMRDVPGIQAADMLAWAVNRNRHMPEGAPWKKLSDIMMTVIPSSSVIWDEQKLRHHYPQLIHPPC